MQKKQELKLYGFKFKGEENVNLFNHTDLIGYEKDDNGKWVCNGFSWLVRNPHYIINTFYDFYHGKYWESLTENEFNEIVANDDDLKDFDCKLLSSDYPIEKLFNLTVVYAYINTIADLEAFSDNATFTQMSSIADYGEPMYYNKSEMISEIEDNNNIGKYRIIY